MMRRSRIHIETSVVHGGQHPDDATGAISPPLYQTSTFAFRNADHGARLFKNEEKGYIYTRIANPTIDLLARKMAVLESTEAGLVFSSGLAAILAVMITFARSGDHIISDDTVYGGTFALFKNVLPRLGIRVTCVDAADGGELEKAFTPKSRMIFIETPANPTLKVIDIARCAGIADKHKVLLCVDNTFATPCLQRPVELGADIVVHSATKYLGGHGDVVGGIAVGRRDMIERIQRETAKETGATASPFNAWLTLRGIKTLAVRMARHCENAREIARFLKRHPRVEKIYYPGVAGDPGYQTARKQMSDFGGMIGFDVKGGKKAGKILMNSVNLCILAVSLGDVDTLIEHPASMTHSAYSAEDLRRCGIGPGFVRLSAGIENARDIIDDLKQALEAVGRHMIGSR